MGAGAGGNFGNTKGRTGSKSKKDSHLFGKPGQVKKSGYKETHIGSDGRASYEKHNTDHGNPKYHTNPHYHKIEWDKNGNPIFKNERK